MPKPIFSYFSLKLRFPDGPPDNVSGKALLGLAYRYLKAASGKMADDVHSRNLKPFTISLLRRNRNDPSEFFWRWSVTDLDVYLPLSRLIYQEWATKRERSLNAKKFVLQEVDLDKGRRSCLWTDDDLVEAAETRMANAGRSHSFGFIFTSPTAFKESGDVMSLLPIQNLVWGSLSRRLGDTAPGLVDSHTLRKRWTELMIGRYDIRTRHLVFPGFQMRGFTGQIEYFIPRVWTPDDIRMVYILHEAAPFLGLGAKTTQGMGQVRLEKKR